MPAPPNRKTLLLLWYYDASYPHKKSSPPESGLLSSMNFVSSTHHSFSLTIEVSINENCKCVTALVDSGASVNLIHQDLVQELKIHTTKCIPAIHVTTVNNTPIGSSITQETVLVTLKIGLLHDEHLSM